jgi:hypothetical protein
VLRSIEMDLPPEGVEDMDPSALAPLDLVMGAFHSKLRLKDDQTERYLAALRNPHITTLAYPRGRMFNRREGLHAVWPRVFEEAAAQGKALEIDANPNRQDLDADLLQLAVEAGCRISMGTDAHSVFELRFIEFGLALAIRGGVPRERILNYQRLENVLRWWREVRAQVWVCSVCSARQPSMACATMCSTCSGSMPSCWPMCTAQISARRSVLEVDLAAHIRALGLTVLRDHDEGRQEDRLQAHHHRQEAEREAVEDERGAEHAEVHRDPDGQPHAVDVDEGHGAGERRDPVGDAVLGVAEAPDDPPRL